MRRRLRFPGALWALLSGALLAYDVPLGFAASADATAAQRLTCMLGEEPDRVVKARHAGQTSTLDPADTCLAALTRTAHDGRLPDVYRLLLAQLGGDAGAYEKLPLVIGNAVLDGDGRVQIGHGKVMDTVPAPLAFDAGFTLAYLKGAQKLEDADRDPAKLRLLADSCLAVKKDAGPCFSAGFIYGAKAFRAAKAAQR